jgi:hypothetical protein
MRYELSYETTDSIVLEAVFLFWGAQRKVANYVCQSCTVFVSLSAGNNFSTAERIFMKLYCGEFY